MTNRTQVVDAPTLALTFGDPAGVGPEIVAGAWRALFQNQATAANPFPLPASRPIVYGDPDVMRRAVALRRVDVDVQTVDSPQDAVARGADVMPVVRCVDASANRVEYGKISAAGGDAAFRAVNRAIDDALSGRVNAIVTAPLHKEALNLAGHHFPGHTEILASRCGVDAFGMALYLGPCKALASSTGLGVVHVTLHESMRQALSDVSESGVFEKISLIRNFMSTIMGREPRIGVCALNCHAGDGGLFGREEIEIIAPAVERARVELGADVFGPQPSDTLFLDAKNGLFDGVVAMYHDQGHIAVKMLDMFAAVNVALGLPIIRTSVAHGTAFNIAGRGIAKTQSLIEAVRVAAIFAQKGATP